MIGGKSNITIKKFIMEVQYITHTDMEVKITFRQQDHFADGYIVKIMVQSSHGILSIFSVKFYWLNHLL